jgi:hypothetical protein
MARTEVIARSTHSDSLADILERVLDKGVVIAGDIKIKLCDVELLSIQIRLLICSVDKAKEMGMTWWWQETSRPAVHPPHLPAAPPPLPHSSAGTPWQQYVEFQQAMRSSAPGTS